MKVPVLDQSEVMPTPPPPERALRVSVDTQGAFGQQVGQAVSGLTSAVTAAVARAREQAAVSDATDAETQLQDHINSQFYDPQNGLMFKKGDQLFPDQEPGSQGMYPRGQKDLGAQAMDSIAAKRDELASGLTDPAAKRVFQMRSNGLLEQANRQVEMHVGQQIQVANEASLRGSQAVHLQAIANNYDRPDAVALYTAAPEGPIQALALSPEDAQAKLQEWHRQVASTVLNQYLANHDFKGAQAYFAQARDQLGADAPEYQNRISALDTQLKGAQNAATIMAHSLTPTGRPDRAAAMDAWSAMPEGPAKDSTMTHLDARLSMAEGAWKQAESERLGRVEGATQKNGGTVDESSDDFQALSAPDQVVARDRAASMRARERGLTAEESRAQADQLKDILETAKGMHDDDLVKLNPQDYPDFARKPLAILQKSAQDRLDKGQSEPMDELRAQVRAVGSQLGMSKGQLDGLTANMVTWWEGERQKSAKGLPPPRTEVAKQFAQELQVGDGMLWGSDNTFRFERERAGESFTPGTPEHQVYGPSRDALTVPAAATTPAAAPTRPAPVAQAARAAPAGVVRVKGGKLIVWDGKKWVPGE